MADSRSITKPDPSWKKLAMIPVLGLVLLYVVASPSDKAAAPTLVVRPPQAPPDRPALPTTVVAKPTGSKNVSQSTPGSVQWPSTPLADVLAFNPFKMPDKLQPLIPPVTETTPSPLEAAVDLRESDSAKVAELKEALKSQRLTGLVQTTKGIGAIVGDNVVGVGDVVGERLRITAIRTDGIVVELINKPATPDSTPEK